MSIWESRTTRRNFLIGGALALAGAGAYGAYQYQSLFRSQAFPPSPPLGPRFDLAHPEVVLRRHPYPFKASLALTSDIDGTSHQEFRNIHRFLNTLEETERGRGLGLDVADSCWMVVNTDWEGQVDPSGQPLSRQMSYWEGMDTTREYNARVIRKYTERGWIDSVHSYGDFNRKNESEVTFTRAIAEASIREWQDKGLKFTVWIDHGNRANVQNFGSAGNSDHNYQQGDNPASPYYHTDLLIPYGIRFVWNSAMAKEESSFHYPDLLYPITLRDGQKVWGFRRYSCTGRNWKGEVQFLWSPYKLHQQITEQKLDTLVAEEGFASIAQHFGGPSEMYLAFPNEAMEPLQGLANRQKNGEILVTRTSRLLQYNRVNNFLAFRVEKQAETTAIIIEAVRDPHLGPFQPSLDDLRGITFYCPDPANTRLFLNREPIPERLVEHNPADHTGRKSISIRWFPAVVGDHSDWG